VALYVVATPIGTVDDLSPRAREVLGRVAVVLAEDTRTTAQLLRLVGVHARRLEAVHAHNERARAEALAAMAGEHDVALVTDAGTPGVSDPGREVVEAALAAGVEVRSVPGPSALATALSVSGLPAAPSRFLGFPPRKGRDGFAAELLGSGDTAVVYEAPGRVLDLVQRLAALDPGREAALCRELSKRFEEVVRAPLGELAARLAARDPLRGECVLVVGPGAPLVRAAPEPEGDDLKSVAAALASRWGVSKREAYQALLGLERTVRGDGG
jgi:16S rRNA (cytidine1402-2'-O)-methyltransferase